jgi:glutamate--cysteine ligase
MAGFALDRILERRLAALVNSRIPAVLSAGLRGLEKESLRVRAGGQLADTQHPAGLGSALCNPNITTDYSESLIELVTPTFSSNSSLWQYLRQLQLYVYNHMEEELLWCASMPCELASDAEVPIAWYGKSHDGRFKEIYRRGLLTRYGGMMQAIAGIHFNYSLPKAFWPVWAEVLKAPRADADFVSARYFELLRNFRRHGWLVSYLFGASPAACKSFLQGQPDSALLPWRDDTVFGPHATSLRMSDMGYRNRNQAAVQVSVNSLKDYLRDLMLAVHTPHPPFAALGVKVDGEYRQLSANILQIENEYYSSMRPKRAPRSGELTGHALARGGVEYVELRSLDLDAQAPESVTELQLNFLEAFLVLLLLKDSRAIENSEQEQLDHNHLLITRSGRDPALRLSRDGRPVAPASWAAELLEEMVGVCELLDAGNVARPFSHALRAQRDKISQPLLLPAAQLLREMQEHGESFAQLSLRHSIAHRKLAMAVTAESPLQQALTQQALESLELQARKDASVTGSFDDYLRTRLADNNAAIN